MATEKQIRANRSNALKSSGPKTKAGKLKSRLNALKHGLTAEHVVVFDESATDFERFYHDVVEALEPVGTFEEQLSERIAIASWRLRRVYRIENQIFRDAMSDLEAGYRVVLSSVALDVDPASLQRRADPAQREEASGDSPTHERRPRASEAKNSGWLGPVFRELCQHSSPIADLSRYEARLERSMYRALHELQRLQAGRRGERVPAPGSCPAEWCRSCG